MQVDPDTVDVKLPWGNGRWGWSVAAAVFVAGAVAEAWTELNGPDPAATLWGVVVAAGVGIAWSVMIWFVDRWWDGRADHHMVTENLTHEAGRWAPAMVLWIVGAVTFSVAGSGGGGLYGLVALFFMIATYFVLVTPIHTRRRYVRRNLRGGLIPPPAPVS